ncbi:hypothetical protein FACS1894110_23790 [Spirochaetia bacterium]|nr:hypothetical protein FACS1894110_23790 [Spirochaetia bacterium]
MSSRTSILEKNWTAYPNELIRNYNNLMTKNERNLMIYLWDRLYGYDYPKHELSYSMILKDCHNFPKNNKKLSETIQGLEKKGLLKVYRKYEKTNKYFIGEKQYNCLRWYGKFFKGWKAGEEIELPQELIDNEEIEMLTNEPQEETLFEEKPIEVETEPLKNEPKKVKDLTIEERNTMLPHLIGLNDLPPFILNMPIEKAVKRHLDAEEKLKQKPVYDPDDDNDVIFDDLNDI